MNPNDFQTQFDNAIDIYASGNQFGVSKVPVHSHNGTDSVRFDFNNLDNKVRFILFRIVDSLSNTTVANVVGGDFVIPFNGYVTSVGATVDTSGTTNVTTVDINKNGTSIMKTKITIDSAEKTSRTAAIPSIVNPTIQQFSTGDIFTFDVDSVSTTAAKGLTVFMNVVDTTN